MKKILLFSYVKQVILMLLCFSAKIPKQNSANPKSDAINKALLSCRNTVHTYDVLVKLDVNGIQHLELPQNLKYYLFQYNVRDIKHIIFYAPHHRIYISLSFAIFIYTFTQSYQYKKRKFLDRNSADCYCFFVFLYLFKLIFVSFSLRKV